MGQRLTQIATRTGDDGSTGLGDGTRVPKDHLRVQAMGDVDELNSSLGVLLAEPLPEADRELLVTVQHELFNLGGELSIPLPFMPTRALTIRGSYVGNPKELRELVGMAREGRVAPLPVRALLDAASSEEAGAVGLLLKKNPVVVRAVQEGIAETRRESQAEGRRQGLLEAIEIVCDALGLELSAERRASLGPMDAAALKWLLARIQVERRWPG